MTRSGTSPEMRYFGREGMAARYAASRPPVHAEVLRAALPEDLAPRAALDAGCGTGHSTAPLAAWSDAVFGCDASTVMLAQACSRVPTARFAAARAEALPFAAGCFELVTTCMAFHWFDQERFLAEAARVLEPGGLLVAYNLVFPGRLVGDAAFSRWFGGVYLERFPTPDRDRTSLGRRLSKGGGMLGFERRVDVELQVDFTARGLRDYLTSQSNVEAALRAGARIEEVDAWLDGELAAFFDGAAARAFAYEGRAELARRVS